MTEPKKFDTDKPRYDLLPPKALGLLVDCLTYGAKKYDDYNWRKDGGIDPNRLFAATQRHLWAWKDGETNDKESGLPHLAHAATNLLMMLDLACRPPVKIPNFNPKPEAELKSAVKDFVKELEAEPIGISDAESDAYYWLSRCAPGSWHYRIAVGSEDLVVIDDTPYNRRLADNLHVLFDMRLDEKNVTLALLRTPSGHKIRSLLNAKS